MVKLCTRNCDIYKLLKYFSSHCSAMMFVRTFKLLENTGTMTEILEEELSLEEKTKPHISRWKT